MLVLYWALWSVGVYAGLSLYGRLVLPFFAALISRRIPGGPLNTNKIDKTNKLDTNGKNDKNGKNGNNGKNDKNGKSLEHSNGRTRRRPVLDPLMTIDRCYIAIAKLLTILFAYHIYIFVCNTPLSRINIDFTNIDGIIRSLVWLPFHLVALFIIYDFFYTPFHLGLHWPPLYPFIHKHHHRQVTPFRGIEDSINDHPIEYIIGEYLHLLSIYILTRFTPVGQVHAFTVVLFIFIGGTLAGLNHTRIDVRIPYMFNVRAHDLHHLKFHYNYGQYIMLWDWVFGTFKSEPVTDKERD